jgi:2'-5' RNA ligase
MAILTIKVPEDVSVKLSNIQVPGVKVPVSEKHITLLYLGDDVSIDVLGSVVIETARVTERIKPFKIHLKNMTSFPQGKDGYPVICPVVSKEIHGLHDALGDALDVHGIEYDKKWPEFKPHVTLSYAEDKPKDKKIDEITWTCNEVMLWGGDHGEHRLSTKFEFLG